MSAPKTSQTAGGDTQGASSHTAHPTVVIVNEVSGGGKTIDRFRRAEHELEDRVGDLDVVFTDGPGHATELAREALERGAERVLVAGGDGTVHETIQGFFHADGRPVRPGAALGLLVGGTGGDLRKSLGVRDMEDALRAAEAHAVRTIDLGRVTFVGHDGAERSRWFANIASFGMSGNVDKHVPTFGALPGKLAYAAATVRSMLDYHNPMVHLRLEGIPQRERRGPNGGPRPDEEGMVEVTQRIFTVAVANGRFFGGGMQVAPDAQLDDGLLTVTALGDLTRWEAMALARPLYHGAHVYDPKVWVRDATRVVAEPAQGDGEVLLDIDGEPLGRLPATFTVVPGALPVLVPPPTAA